MSRQRFIALCVAAVLAISGALYLSTQRNLPRDPHGTPLLPWLAGEMNTVTTLTIRKGGPAPAVTIRKQAEQWTVMERGDYPADVSKLRKLLLALSDARIIEEKTSNPASFPIIGVEDPSSPGAKGAEVGIVAASGKHAVIIGKAGAQGSFVRRGGENTSYLVEPFISVDTEPRSWIDSKLLDVAAATIQSIEIKPATGPAYTLHRAAAPGDANFVLDGVPSGRKAVDSAALAPSPSTYGGLTADDVAPASDVDFKSASVATLTLSGGGGLTLTGTAAGDKHWVEIKASKDDALNAKAAGRAFEISAYRYDAIFRPLEQLLVPKEPPPGSSKPTSQSNKPGSPANGTGHPSPATAQPSKKRPPPPPT
jgi:hypothetical protein